MKKKLVIFVALVIVVVWFYLNERVVSIPTLHDTFAQVVELDKVPKNTLRNEHVQSFLVSYMFPEFATFLKENIKDLIYSEVTYGKEPSFLITAPNYEGDGAAILYDSELNKSVDIPKGPWAKFSTRSLLQLDSGYGTDSDYILTPGGYVYWVMNHSFSYDEALYGVYFYDKKSWHRLTPKVFTYSIDITGCNLYYGIGDKQHQQTFKLDVCSALNLEVPTVPAKKTFSEGNIIYSVGFTQSVTQEYTKDFKPSLKKRTFDIKVYQGCPKSSFEISFGDGTRASTVCDSKVTHTYNDYGIYYAEIVYNGIVLEREKVVVPEPIINKVDFELRDIKKFRDGYLRATLTYSVSSQCNEDILAGNYVGLIINNAKIPDGAQCQDTREVFFKNDSNNITFGYLLNWDVVASSSFKNPFFGK